MRSKFLCSLLLLTSIAVAQTPSTSPQLSELDKTKLELIMTKLQLTQIKSDAIVKEGQALSAELQQTVITIEAKYPGYAIQQQQKDSSFILVEKPKAPEAPIKTTPKK